MKQLYAWDLLNVAWERESEVKCVRLTPNAWELSGLLTVINKQQRRHFWDTLHVYAGSLVEKHQWIFYNNKRLYINEVKHKW
jgi:hypothetical protein